MRLPTIISLACLATAVSACGLSIPSSIHLMARGDAQSLGKRTIGVSPQHPVAQNSEDHWTVAENERQMQVSDDAFIAKDFAHFNHHPNSTMYYPGGVVMNLTEHIEDLRLYFSSYPDAAPHNHNYRVMFGEGDWTVAISVSSAINGGAVSDLSGNWLPPTMRPVKFDLMTIARWDGADNLPDIELNPYTAPLSTKPGVDNAKANKATMTKADDAFNAGTFTAEALHLSEDVKVYGLTDQPLDLKGFLATLKSLRKSFPDLHLDNKPYRQIIAQGDWTATVAMLSGTFKGPLELPPYLGSSPAQPTGRKFDLLHYTICRWQDGKILEMRINADIFSIVGSLGIQLE
ncbi:uncharacterized protein FFUJ_06645 [Fusarium fujikuroi IMI 58289]|uniref:SnoaL-like domain-containing protein n=1 Tax=Gibberella fujikuroi (strain CBS 195.34 / IMI 58289 / NRRL A-6831) TaxID=1279085 RepID=S0E738_GIBF5|nr:uncharacterized protein FFUJ_06645 [Fusarium fujikuroi IMI 58289]CCT70656.1 uncharacterized protein FFUJ_06645 [Fusarium fujikuroi IMI 58289]